MARLPELDEKRLTAGQREVYNRIKGALEDERFVYDITIELNMTSAVSEATFRRGLDLFGEQKLVKLVSSIGFYAMVAMTLNVFEVPLPAGKKPLI